MEALVIVAILSSVASLGAGLWKKFGAHVVHPNNKEFEIKIIGPHGEISSTSVSAKEVTSIAKDLQLETENLQKISAATMDN